jgi:hypothetical protein
VGGEVEGGRAGFAPVGRVARRAPRHWRSGRDPAGARTRGFQRARAALLFIRAPWVSSFAGVGVRRAVSGSLARTRPTGPPARGSRPVRDPPARGSRPARVRRHAVHGPHGIRRHAGHGPCGAPSARGSRSVRGSAGTRFTGRAVSAGMRFTGRAGSVGTRFTVRAGLRRHAVHGTCGVRRHAVRGRRGHGGTRSRPRRSGCPQGTPTGDQRPSNCSNTSSPPICPPFNNNSIPSSAGLALWVRLIVTPSPSVQR